MSKAPRNLAARGGRARLRARNLIAKALRRGPRSHAHSPLGYQRRPKHQEAGKKGAVDD